ncbi:hypothetical protein [Methanosphaerula palustris]|uniref:Uncharacterized protein n=1 Tax=Methanosphaerula palustris (strain ATCC BAA-1556 / DSM 19958 / E1-9c) TaxID=521011 RepID=B8GIF2_METPE|nr:hypothetical protein [Methanosphaerula palustris]ACL15503.1 hypothetical protein Mpal_0110 [Methanosphaerula palustris E1-9c]
MNDTSENQFKPIAQIIPEFVTGLVADLRKVGVIRGNDTKIQLSGT